MKFEPACKWIIKLPVCVSVIVQTCSILAGLQIYLVHKVLISKEEVLLLSFTTLCLSHNVANPFAIWLNSYFVGSLKGNFPEWYLTWSCSFKQDYQTNNNDQAVVEICITRITTAIRETESIEKHAKALVGLWDSCLEHNLRPSGKDEDTPHAKIASDIMSCILQVCLCSASCYLILAWQLSWTRGVSEPRASVSVVFRYCKKTPQTINS